MSKLLVNEIKTFLTLKYEGAPTCQMLQTYDQFAQV